MARERRPERDQAKQMWLNSGGTIKLKDIAASLSVSEQQVRKWKSQDRWQDALNGNVTNESKGNAGAPKGNRNAIGNKGGAPPGNKNARGNSGGRAPLRNKNALIHGIYATVFLDALDEDEQQLLANINPDPRVQAEEQLAMLTIQERRHLRRIKQLEAGLTDHERKIKQELASRTDKVQYANPKTGKLVAVPLTTEGMKVTEVTTIELPKLDKILKQEEALTKVRDKKIRLINQIANMDLEQEKMQLARERMELERYKVLGRGDDNDHEDNDDDGDDLGW